MIKKSSLLICLIVIATLVVPKILLGESTDELKNQEIELTNKVNELRKSKNTLANQLKLLDSQINLNILKINQTESFINTLEQDIDLLTAKISGLDSYLNQLSSAYIHQITQNYKLQKRVPLISLFLTSDLNVFLQQYKYVSMIQKSSQDSLINLETTRTNYDLQKQEKTKKQQELETLQKTLASQKNNLNNQKATKNNLLEVTKNDEKEYQNRLAEVRSELAAIEAVIAGLGVETKAGLVNEGDKVATVINGKSCSSGGTHLHFMVKTQNGEVKNPFNYLKQIDHKDNSRGDSFNPTGNWSWPLSPQISFNQGYGATWAIRNTWVGNVYSFHTGIDISGSSNNVYATQKGTLYRGSYYIKSQKCTLKYVRIENNDSKIDTLNLHVNYF